MNKLGECGMRRRCSRMEVFKWELTTASLKLCRMPECWREMQREAH